MTEKSKQLVVRTQPMAVAVASDQVRTAPKKSAMDEEEFTETMSKIIRRDFFPDVPKLKAQLAYIEATETNDVERLKEISERFAAENVTPALAPATPTTFETPLSGSTENRKRQGGTGEAKGMVDEREMGSSKKPCPEDSKSLDLFLANYHSEDDASFVEIMEKSQQEQRRRYAWLYEREEQARQSVAALTSGTALQALEGSSSQPLAITDGKMEGEGSSGGQLNAWNYTAKNSLMYIPEGMDDGIKEKIRKSNPREIHHTNTRLSRDFIKKQQSAVVAAANVSGEGPVTNITQAVREKVGIDGRQLRPTDSPQVGGYGFVATPQIYPGVDASPLMTWGEIEGTPFHLESDIIATPGPTFKMPKAPKRDELAHKLADKVTKRQRDKKKQAMAQATSTLLSVSPSMRRKLTSPLTSARMEMLSPAARKLINKASTPGSQHGQDKALRASYTPSHTPLGTPTHTPQHTGHRKDRTPGNTTPSLSDNLLNLK